MNCLSSCEYPDKVFHPGDLSDPKSPKTPAYLPIFALTYIRTGTDLPSCIPEPYPRAAGRAACIANGETEAALSGRRPRRMVKQSETAFETLTTCTLLVLWQWAVH